ncbi:hypothetical protein [Roseibacillus persicicus]|uniref:hypothetical protein n=1 Tax=Roseibacillus persicicus TaxID=454148 RepID=UPI00167467F0|nr:hypothetical protein [Roseibacillus persicicus]
MIALVIEKEVVASLMQPFLDRNIRVEPSYFSFDDSESDYSYFDWAKKDYRAKGSVISLPDATRRVELTFSWDAKSSSLDGPSGSGEVQTNFQIAVDTVMLLRKGPNEDALMLVF